MARTLVIGPSWVGDMVMAQALFKRIARLDPGGEVHVVSPGWSQSLTERMPEVTRAYVLDVPHGSFGFARRRDLGRALAPMGFDRAFVLPRSWKSALVPFFAGARRRTGYRGEMRYGLLNDIVPRNAVPVEGGAKPRTVDEFVALADPSEPCMRPEEMPRLRRDPDSEAATADGRSTAMQRWRVLWATPAGRSGSSGPGVTGTTVTRSPRPPEAMRACSPAKRASSRPLTFWR